MEHIFEQGVATIIVPCYNGEFYLGRLLDSILVQTYKKLELIFVNDGSIDNTAEVFFSFERKLEKRGIRYTYLYQHNQGQAAAINTALPYVRGEFMMWMDADDFISSDHVEQKVECLRKNPNCAIVQCQGARVEEKDTNKNKGLLCNKIHRKNLFENILFELCGCCNGCYMVRSMQLFRLLPAKKIYVSRVGQNLQLLLPVLYLHQTCYIDEILFFYVERKDSHSHKVHNIEDWHVRLDEISIVKLNIIQEMNKFFTEKYGIYLKNQLKLLDVFQRINKIISYNYEERQDVYIEEVIIELFKFIKQSEGQNKYWIWGACEKSYRLAVYLKKYSGVKIEGFIDSDIEKQKGERIIAPENINVSQMYIIIILEYHQEIVEYLYNYNFIDNINFFYPKYEIIRNLTIKENVDREEG